MSSKVLDVQGREWKQPVEKARRLIFDNDEDQEYFQMMYNSLSYVEDLLNDIRMMFVLSRLFSKLERFSVPAPAEVPPLTLKRRQRMLPPYPGHPVALDLILPEMSLIELALQVVPWDLENARLAAKTYEFMLRSELVELPVFRSMFETDADLTRRV